MSLTAITFWIAYVTGTFAAVFNPIAGVVLYVLVYHLNPEGQWWGDSIKAVGLRTSMTLVLATTAGMIVRRPKLEPGARQFPLPFTLGIAFLLVCLLSLTWGVEVGPRSHMLLEKFSKQLIFLFILIRCVRTPLHYQAVFMSWLVGMLYLGWQAQGGVGHHIQGRLTGGLGGPDFAESSGLGVHLVATLPLIGAFFFMARTWWGRIFALATGALTVNVLIATRTRNALFGLAVICFVGVLSLPKKYRTRGIAGVVLGLVLAAHLTDGGWWKRMETIKTYEQDAAATQRLTLWQAAFEIVDDYPLGIGIGNFQRTVMDYVPGLKIVRSAHNSLLECLAELGWLGLAVFSMTIAVTIWRLSQIRRLAHDLPPFLEIRYHRFDTRFHLGWHAMALRTALLGYMACSMFVTRLFTEDLWLLIGMAACLQNVSRSMAIEYEASLAQPTSESDAPSPAASAPPRPLPAPGAGGTLPGMTRVRRLGTPPPRQAVRS